MKLWEDNPAMFTLFLIAPTIISNAIILSKKHQTKIILKLISAFLLKFKSQSIPSLEILKNINH